MKILRLIAIAAVSLIGLTAAALVVSGRREGAGKLSGSIEIDVSAERLRPWLTEPEKLKQWVGWLLEIRETGPGKEVWVMDDPNNNQRMEIQAEVLEDSPRLLRARVFVPETFDGTSEFRLAELSANRTRLEQTGSFVYTQWVHQLLEPLITPAGNKKLSEDLARLKLKAEQ